MFSSPLTVRINIVEEIRKIIVYKINDKIICKTITCEINKCLILLDIVLYNVITTYIHIIITIATQCIKFSGLTLEKCF